MVPSGRLKAALSSYSKHWWEVHTDCLMAGGGGGGGGSVCVWGEGTHIFGIKIDPCLCAHTILNNWQIINYVIRIKHFGGKYQTPLKCFRDHILSV